MHETVSLVCRGLLLFKHQWSRDWTKFKYIFKDFPSQNNILTSYFLTSSILSCLHFFIPLLFPPIFPSILSSSLFLPPSFLIFPPSSPFRHLSFLLPPSSSSPDGECWDEHLDLIIKPCVLVSVTIERAVC